MLTTLAMIMMLNTALVPTDAEWRPDTRTHTHTHTQDQATPAADLRPGWRWLIGPGELTETWPEHGFVRMADSLMLTLEPRLNGELHALLVRRVDTAEQGIRTPEFDLFLHDRAGNRIPMSGFSTMHNGELSFTRYTFSMRRGGEQRSLAEIGRVGLAVLDFEGRHTLAETAAREADEVGAKVLPLPVIGEPYEFDLPLLDGGNVTSAELKGRVVLIDFWAAWCGPCMAKMPALRELYRELGPEGLVIIGINMDNDPRISLRTIAEHDLDWPHVHSRLAAADQPRFWNEITSITGIPRAFVIDREGVLRADIRPAQLAATLRELVRE